jgi:hypothetical protein
MCRRYRGIRTNESVAGGLIPEFDLVQPDPTDPAVMLTRAYVGTGERRMPATHIAIARSNPFRLPVR